MTAAAAAFLKSQLPYLVENFITATYEGTSRSARTIITLADAMERQIAGVGPLLLQAHQEIGREAQTAVVSAYHAARSAGRHSGPYRSDLGGINHRYAGGVLERALSSPNMWEATEVGLNFVNVSALDSAARQWARLNFGASPGAGASGRSFQVRWSNLVVASLGFEQGPSAGFSLPVGFWTSDRGGGSTGAGDTFVPYALRASGLDPAHFRTPTKRMVTKGIPAENFLDAGLETIAVLMPQAYLNIYRTLYANATTEAQRVMLQGSQPRLVRPGRPSSSVVEAAVRADLGDSPMALGGGWALDQGDQRLADQARFARLMGG